MIRAALRNPYAVVAISLIVVLLGVVSYQKMVVDIFPEINTPVRGGRHVLQGNRPLSEMEGSDHPAAGATLPAGFLRGAHRIALALSGISLIKIYFHPEYTTSMPVSQRSPA